MSINPRKRKKQRLFTRDIENLLFSLGDGPTSLDSTINTLEEALVEYLCDLSTDTLRYARSKNRNRIKIDDLPFTLRNDPAKLSRLEYVLNQSQRIARARRMFDDDDKKMANYGDDDDFGDDDDDEDDGDDDEGQNKSSGAKPSASKLLDRNNDKKKKKKKQKVSE